MMTPTEAFAFSSKAKATPTIPTTNRGHVSDITTPEGIISSDKRSQAVLLHLRNLCNILPFHIAELWMQDDQENSLVQAFCSNEIQHDPYLMGKYNDGHQGSMTSRNMCKRGII